MPQWGDSFVYTPDRHDRNHSELMGIPELPSVPYKVEWDQRKGTFICLLCEREIGDKTYVDQHIKSKKHLSNIWWNQFEEADRNPGSATMGDPAIGIPKEIECRGSCWFKCSVCDVLMYNPDSVIQHCNGRRHMRNVSHHLNGSATRDGFRSLNEIPGHLRLELTPLKSPVLESGGVPRVCSSPSAWSSGSEWGSSVCPSPTLTYFDGPRSPLPDELPYKIMNGRIIPRPPTHCPVKRNSC